MQITVRSNRWRLLAAVVALVLGVALVLARLEASRDPAQRVYDRVRTGMTEAELHQIDGFDRVFHFEGSFIRGDGYYRATGEQDGHCLWICTIQMSRDRVVTSKDWHHIGDDTELGRLLADVLNWLDWREGHRYSAGQPGQTFSF